MNTITQRIRSNYFFFVSALISFIISSCNGILQTAETSIEATFPANIPTESSNLSQDLPASIRFENISAADGLSSNAVRTITQDQTGYLWIGTQDGLNRYDGYRYQIFRHDPSAPDSLRDNFIETIYEDQSGTLWIGTQSGWLEKYHPETNTFSHVHLGSRVLSIYEDSQGNLWVGTFDPGLFIFDRETETAELILPGGNFTSIVEDADGRLWAASPDEGLLVIDPHTFAHRSVPSKHPINQMLPGQADEIWLGTYGGGLGLLDPKTETIILLPFAQDGDIEASDSISTLYQDALGRLWMGTWDQGLYVYSPETETFVNFQSDPLDPNSLSNNTVVDILVDHSGVLWVGNEFGGLNKAPLNAFDFGFLHHQQGTLNSLVKGTVTSILEDDDGDLWVGTLGGLSRLNRAQNTWQNYYEVEDKPLDVRSLYLSEDGQLWVGAESGFYQYDHHADEFTYYDIPVVMWMMEDPDGTFWLATKGGLYQFDPVTGEATFVFKGISWKIFVFEDASGNLWVGSSGDGVEVRDASTGEWRHYDHDPEDATSISGDFIETIHQDASGNLWIGTNNGLNKYDPETETFSHYFVSDGLPHHYVVGILEDDQGHLWLSTLGGLSRFDPQNELFENYYQSDGLQGNVFWRNAYHQNMKGEMMFGGVNGINVFNPGKIEKNTVIPSIAITAISLFNDPAFLNPSNGDSIELTYQENFLSFDFAAFDFTDPTQNQFAYQMAGVDDEFVPIGNRTHVDYPDLDPGDYTFRVIGSNNDGVWNEEGAWVHITIQPPFWQTTWFISLVIAALLSAGYGASRYRVRRLRARSLQLEKEVSQRTSELESTNLQLEQEIAERERVEGLLTEKAAEEAVAEERTRLARELHDAVTQTLFSTSLLAEALPTAWETDPEEGHRLLTEIRQLSRGALAELRTLLHELRPTTIIDTTMPELLRQLGEALTGREGIPVNVTVECRCHLPADVHAALYRIAQEALNNIVKHARANTVSVQLTCSKCAPGQDTATTAQEVALRITDNGRGFNVQAQMTKGMGLGIMHERAESIHAAVRITSHPGQGTQISVVWKGRENEDDE